MPRHGDGYSAGHSEETRPLSRSTCDTCPFNLRHLPVQPTTPSRSTAIPPRSTCETFLFDFPDHNRPLSHLSRAVFIWCTGPSTNSIFVTGSPAIGVATSDKAVYGGLRWYYAAFVGIFGTGTAAASCEARASYNFAGGR